MTDDDLQQIIQAETTRLEKTRARHARETKGKIGKAMQVSRESIRKAAIVDRTFSDGRELIMAGHASVDKLYCLAVGDTRVGLYVKIAPELKERLRDAAFDRGITLTKLVEDTLTQIFG